MEGQTLTIGSTVYVLADDPGKCVRFGYPACDVQARRKRIAELVRVCQPHCSRCGAKGKTHKRGDMRCIQRRCAWRGDNGYRPRAGENYGPSQADYGFTIEYPHYPERMRNERRPKFDLRVQAHRAEVDAYMEAHDAWTKTDGYQAWQADMEHHQRRSEQFNYNPRCRDAKQVLANARTEEIALPLAA